MSKKFKLSPWHDGSVKPVHVGVYEVTCTCQSHKGQTMFSKWSGSFFCCVNKQIQLAHDEVTVDNFLVVGKWRGVLK